MKIWILALLLVATAGCATEDESPENSDEPNPTTEGNSTVEAVPEMVEPLVIEVGLTGAYPVNIAYDPETIEVPAGATVTIRFTNNDMNPVVDHDWVLEGVEGASTASIGNGETTEITFQAPPIGEYAFFCSIGNHRSVGMEGTFVVV